MPMGALTEVEILDCLEENSRIAIDACDHLARSPVRGRAYNRLWDALELCVGCFRQAAAWRQDARWYGLEQYVIGVRMAAGNWIRGWSVIVAAHGQVPRRLTQKMMTENFKAAADLLRKVRALVIKLRDEKTGRLGVILPKPVENFRETRQHRVANLPAPMLRTPGGLIIPSGAAAR